MLRDQGVSYQRIKTWKESTDPDYKAKRSGCSTSMRWLTASGSAAMAIDHLPE
jgi:hypothetical protein